MERRTLLATAVAGLAAGPAAAQPAPDSAAGNAAVLPQVGDPGELRGDMLYRSTTVEPFPFLDAAVVRGRLHGVTARQLAPEFG